MTIRSRVAGLAAAALALAAAACGDGGPTTPGGPALVAAADTARVGGLLSFTLRGASTAGTLAADVAGTTAAVAAVNDSTLVLAIPAVAAGPQAVTVTVGGRGVATRVTIQPALQVADPGSALTGTADAYAAVAPTVRPASMTDAEWSDYRGRVDSLVADVRARIAAATPEQRLTVARWLASQGIDASIDTAGTSAAVAGSIMFRPTAADSGTLVGGMSSAAVWGLETPCGKASLRAVRLSILAVVSVAGFAAAVVVPADPISKALAISLTALAAVGTVPLAHDAWQDVAGACATQRTVAVEADPFASAALRVGAAGAALLATDWRFTDGAALVRYAGGAFRPVSGSDVAGDPTLAEGSGVVDRMYALLEPLPAAMRALIPALPLRLSTLAQRPDVMRAVAPALVRIENVIPSSVTLAAAVAGDALRLTATGAGDADIPFTFDVVSTENAAVRQQVAAVLAALRYRVTWPDGGALPDTVRFADGQPFSFVLAQDGNPGAAIDYAQVQVTGNTNSAVTVSRTAESGAFTLRLTSVTIGTSATSFTITYKGRAVQTVRATVTSGCDATGLFGTWTATQGYGATTAGNTGSGSWNPFAVWVYGGNFSAMATGASMTIAADSSYTATITWYQTAPDGTGRYGPGGNPIGGDVTTTYTGRLSLFCTTTSSGAHQLGIQTASGVGTMTGTESNFDAPAFSSTSGVPYGWSYAPGERRLDWSAAFSPGIFLTGSFRAAR